MVIDAECQQLHNGDYRFDDVINGGKNGVFSFSADWRDFRGLHLDFLPWKCEWIQAWRAVDRNFAGICGCFNKLLSRAVRRGISVGPNVGMAQRDFGSLPCRLDLHSPI